MLGVDDLGESGCPRWSYGDGVLNTGYESFTQNIHSVNLSYVLYRTQVVIGGLGMVVHFQSMNILHKIFTVSIYHIYHIQVVTLG